MCTLYSYFVDLSDSLGPFHITGKRFFSISNFHFFFFFFAFFFLAVMWQCPLDANFGRLRLVSSKHVFCSWLGREEERSFLTFNESCCYLIVVGFEFSILPPWIGSKESGVACFMKNEWRVYLGISV